MIPTYTSASGSEEMFVEGEHVAELDTPEPLAIIGLSFQFPGGAVTDDAFWDLIVSKQCAASEFPPDRMNIDAFYSSDPKKLGTVGQYRFLSNTEVNACLDQHQGSPFPQ
jgi:hypothetical protein